MACGAGYLGLCGALLWALACSDEGSADDGAPVVAMGGNTSASGSGGSAEGSGAGAGDAPDAGLGGKNGGAAGVDGAGSAAAGGLAGASGSAGAAAAGPAGAGGLAGSGGLSGSGGAAGASGGGCIGELQALWRADGDASDVLGRFPGALMGNMTFTEGRLGQAFRFDGSDDFVQVPHDEALNPAASFSVEAWIKTSYAGGTGTVITNYDCGNICPGHASQPANWLTVSLGIPMFGVRGQLAGSLQEVKGVTPVADGAWHHLVAVRDVENMQLRLYVDGRLDGSVALTPEAAAAFVSQDGEADPLMIGAKYHGEAVTLQWLFPGSIDEVALYFAALDGAQAAALFQDPSARCP